MKTLMGITRGKKEIVRVKETYFYTQVIDTDRNTCAGPRSAIGRAPDS